MLSLTLNERIAEQRVSLKLARLLEVYRVAKSLARGMERIGKREYAIEPSAVLALKSTLAEAAIYLNKRED
jgi:hypothetical protein